MYKKRAVVALLDGHKYCVSGGGVLIVFIRLKEIYCLLLPEQTSV